MNAGGRPNTCKLNVRILACQEVGRSERVRNTWESTPQAASIVDSRFPGETMKGQVPLREEPAED
jgi:hypothetical protein